MLLRKTAAESLSLSIVLNLHPLKNMEGGEGGWFKD